MPDLADIREVFEIHTNISPYGCPVCSKTLSKIRTGNCIDDAINHVLQHGWRLLYVGAEFGQERWTPSTGQLINVAKWNLLRYLPVKMRGAEDDQEETAQSCASV